MYIHWGEIGETIFRTVFSFVLLMIMVHLHGKLISAKMTKSNFAVSITIGSFIANMSFDLNINFFSMLASFLTICLIALTLSYLSIKKRSVRKWAAGRPVTLIEKGQILEGNIKKSFLTMEMLNQFLREKDIFDIEEVEYALLENDGKISILKKYPYRTPINKDLGVTEERDSYMPVELIVDGKMLVKNINKVKKTVQWIEDELRKRSLTVKDVNYAVLNSKRQLFVDVFQDFKRQDEQES